MDTDLFIFILDAGEDAFRSEDVGIDGFSRLDAQKECLLGPVGWTLEQYTTKKEGLLLYTLEEATYHKANVAIIATSRGRASVALHPTCSANDFYSSLCALSTNAGGESNLAAGLALASLLARKAESPRIIAFVAGNISDSSSTSSPLNKNKNNKGAEESELAETLFSKIQSLPSKGSELTLVSLASPKELGNTSVHALESSVGKEKICWVNKNLDEQNQNQQLQCGADDDGLTQFIMDLKLSIAEEAGIPSFIASKSENIPQPTPAAVGVAERGVVHPQTSPSSSSAVSTAATAVPMNPATTNSNSTSFQKAGPLQRSSFSCRDACLDVLLHHSRSGLLRSKMPTYSTLAHRAAQATNNSDTSGGNTSGISMASLQGRSCYIRIMPQPKYRTLLTFPGALLLSTDVSETKSPVEGHVRRAVITAAATRNLLSGTKATSNWKVRRGPIGIVKILQSMTHPEMVLLTWMMPTSSVGNPNTGAFSSEKASLMKTSSVLSAVAPPSGVDDGASSSTAANKSCGEISEPFNMFSGKPPLTLASLLQTIRGGAGSGGGAGGDGGVGGIENVLQNPFTHEGWEYWDQSQPVPFQYMQVLATGGQGGSHSSPSSQGTTTTTTTAAAATAAADSHSNVTVVETFAGLRGGNAAATSTGDGSSSSTDSSSHIVREKGYIVAFNQLLGDSATLLPPSVNRGGEKSGGGGTESRRTNTISRGAIPPIYIPLGEVKEDQYAPSTVSATAGLYAPATPAASSSRQAPGIFTKTVLIFFFLLAKVLFGLGFIVGYVHASITLARCVILIMVLKWKARARQHKEKKSAKMPSLSSLVMGAENNNMDSLTTPPPLLDGTEIETDKYEDALEEKQHASLPSPQPSPPPSSLVYPATPDMVCRMTHRQFESELSSLLTSPPPVSLQDVVQSIRDAVAHNNDNNNNNNNNNNITGVVNGTSGSGGSNVNVDGKTTMISTSVQPPAIIVGPLDPAAVSYLMKQYNQQQHHHNHRQVQQQQRPQQQQQQQPSGHDQPELAVASSSQTVINQKQVIAPASQPQEQQQQQREHPSVGDSPIDGPGTAAQKNQAYLQALFASCLAKKNPDDDAETKAITVAMAFLDAAKSHFGEAFDDVVESINASNMNVPSTSNTSSTIDNSTNEINSTNSSSSTPIARRRIAITMGDSAASGEVAVNINGLKQPLSNSISSSSSDSISNSLEQQMLPSSSSSLSSPTSGAVSIPNEVSGLFVSEGGKQEEDDEDDEVKMQMPLTPPGAVSSAVVTAVVRAGGGLDTSAPSPPNTDSAE